MELTGTEQEIRDFLKERSKRPLPKTFIKYKITSFNIWPVDLGSLNLELEFGEDEYCSPQKRLLIEEINRRYNYLLIKAILDLKGCSSLAELVGEEICIHGVHPLGSHREISFDYGKTWLNLHEKEKELDEKWEKEQKQITTNKEKQGKKKIIKKIFNVIGIIIAVIVFLGMTYLVSDGYYKFHDEQVNKVVEAVQNNVNQTPVGVTIPTNLGYNASTFNIELTATPEEFNEYFEEVLANDTINQMMIGAYRMDKDSRKMKWQIVFNNYKPIK